MDERYGQVTCVVARDESSHHSTEEFIVSILHSL